MLQKKIIDQFPEISFVKLIYRALCNHLKIAVGSGKSESYPIDIVKLSKTFELDIIKVYHGLKILESNGNIHFSENGSRSTSIRWIVSNIDLYNFQINNDKLMPLIRHILRSNTSSLNEYIKLNELKIMKALRINQPTLNEHLKALEKYGIVEISWKSKLPIITFLEERKTDDYFKIKKEAYRDKKERAINKLNFAINFTQTNKCRSNQLLNYFNQKEKKPCGKCDVCYSEQLGSKKDIEKHIIEFLESPKTLTQIQVYLKAKESIIKDALQKLLIKEKLIADENKQQYSLKKNN